MSGSEEWGEPEPFGENENGEPVLWNCPNPDCSTQKNTKAKAAAHCADTAENADIDAGGSADRDETLRVDTDSSPPRNAPPAIDIADADERGAYYNRQGVKDVYGILGRLDADGLPAAQCLGNHDFVGWYQTRPLSDPDHSDKFDSEGAVYPLADDYSEIAAEIDRVLYATTNYQNPDALEWLPFAHGDGGKEWRDDDTPTPEYEDILGFSILADIDLDDDHKERPLPSGTRETVESAISEYVNSFALLTGGRAHVFALDSVGGVYLLTPPAATAPIARAFDGEERQRVFEELRQRADAWLKDVRDDVNAAVPGAEGVFEADLLNQKNRLYKAPLSIHSSIDGVVHPLDIGTGADETTYEFVPVEDVTQALVDETTVWAAEFTDSDHADAIEHIVARLWPEYVDESDDWQDALESWIDDEREREAEQRRKAQKAAEERARRQEQRDDDLPAFTDAASGDGLGIATNFDDVQAAVDRVDPQQVVRQLCDEYDTDPGRDPPRFEPGYRDSKSGTSCFVDSEKITDLDDEHSAIGVLDYVAREQRYIGETDTATGEARGKARDDLRGMGFEIPVYTPVEGSRSYDGEEFDEMPGWARAKAAVALGVCDPDDVEDGWKLSPTHHDALLDMLEEQGIEHGCSRLSDDSPDPQLTTADGGTAAASSDAPTPESTDTGANALTPMSVMAVAGLGEDGDISDLDDRQKAACVWELIERTDEFHVRVRRDNGTLWAYDGGIWKPEGERALRHAARQALGAMEYGPKVFSILKEQARSDPRGEVEADEFGLDTGTVAVKNGLVSLDIAADGEGADARRDLRPDDHALTRLPVEYDPSAEYGEWASLVEEWAEDGKADALQEYVGYCLHIGALPIHRAVLLVGSGANGKGTFLTVVRALLGEENTTSTELQTLANEKDAVADFYGALANIDDDLSTRKLGQGKGMFKKLVGGDRVRARRLYEGGFEFDAVGKHLYAANEVPKVDVPDNDEAFWRRWLLVEFPNFYPPNDRDPDLRERLTDDESLSGVLNWAIEGRRRLLNQGYFTGEEQFAHDKRRRWQSWGDSVDEFISECVSSDDDAARMTTSEAHARYAAWCDEQGADTDAVKQQPFTVRLKAENVGYGKHRIDGKVQRGYTALGLSDDVPKVDDSDDPDDSTQERL